MASPLVGDVAQAAINQFGLDPTQFTDFVVGHGVPRTRTRTSHGLKITIGSRVIGAIQGFTHNTSRQLDEEWELGRGLYGHAPADIVPQNVGQRTLSIERLDLFTADMESVFGTTELVVLADQFRPFMLRTVWQSPVGIALGGRSVFVYTGCWLSRIGRQVRATDDRISRANAEVTYQMRLRVL